ADGAQAVAVYSTHFAIISVDGTVVDDTYGKIVAAGDVTDANGSPAFGLACYNPDGSLDTRFGDNGKGILGLGPGRGSLHTLVIRAEGGMVVGGSFGGPGGDLDFFLAGYERNGEPAYSFGDGGLVFTDFTGGDDIVFALAIQNMTDPQIVAVGIANNGMHSDF